MIKNKRILITGGAGFIGTHMAKLLVEHNDVTVLDKDFSGPISFTSLANDIKLRSVNADVKDKTVIKNEVEKCDIVLHLASVMGVQNVIDNAIDTIYTVTLGLHNVLEAARANGHIERIIYVSTSEVYGNSLNSLEDNPASIGTNNDARLSYASAKLLGEHMVWAYYRDYKLPTVIIRPFNIYGPLRIVNHAVGIFIAKALKDKEISIHGDGSQIRPWCYITDFCRAVIAAIENERAIGQDFNIGNPITSTTIHNLAMEIIRLSNSKSSIIKLPYTYTDIGVRAPNSVKSRELLDYDPEFDLSSGLVPTINWYKKNPTAYEKWL